MNQKNKQSKGTLRITIRTMVFIGVVMIFGQSAFASDSITPNRVVELVNESRLAHDMSVVTVSRELGAAATMKARDMFQKQYFSHDTPDGNPPWYWMGVVEYEYRMAGENLAIHFSDALSQHTAWMESPLHRKNILNPEYLDIGVAVETGMFQGKETTIVVQFFATRKMVAPMSSSQGSPSMEPTVSQSIENVSYSEPKEVTLAPIGRAVIAIGYEILHTIFPTLLLLPFFVLSFSFLRVALASIFSSRLEIREY